MQRKRKVKLGHFSHFRASRVFVNASFERKHKKYSAYLVEKQREKKKKVRAKVNSIDFVFQLE